MGPVGKYMGGKIDVSEVGREDGIRCNRGTKDGENNLGGEKAAK